MIEIPPQLTSLRALSPDVPSLLAGLRPHVVVLGDLVLDSWWTGSVDRMCREAPAPVVEMKARKYAPGGAANTAANLAALGARVTLIGAVGQDAEGEALLSLLQAAGVDTGGTAVVSGTRTATKTRILSSGQILFRLDDGATRLDPAQVAAMGEAAGQAVQEADAFMVADYGSGNLPTHGAAMLRRRARADTVFVVDAHDGRPWAALAPDVVTPNWLEAVRLANGAPAASERHQWLRDRAGAILTATGAASAVVTLDKEGTLLLDSAGRSHRTWARPVMETQTAGAGDTFAAALTLALSCRVPLATAMDFAQTAADIVVHRTGTAVCTTRDLAEKLGHISERVLGLPELARKVAAARQEGRRVVLTNGCFDVLHRGHTSYLNQARQLGDLLIVAVNSDASVRRLKGPGRPLNPAVDRAGVLAALSCVDYVTVFGDDTAIELIEELKPEIYAKGGDYNADMLEESEAVQSNGGRVEILEYVPDHSTTALVQRMSAQPAAPATPA